MSHDWKIGDKFRVKDGVSFQEDLCDKTFEIAEFYNLQGYNFRFLHNSMLIVGSYDHIEYVPHRPGETFRVREKFRLAVSEEILDKTWTIEVYFSGLVYFDSGERTISLECIESADSATHICYKCHCDVMVLMIRGCQCGGQ